MSRYESCSAALLSPGTWCALEAGHGGDHRDVDGYSWPRTPASTLETPSTEGETVSVLSTVAAEISAVEAKLRAEVPAEYHHIVDELKALAEKLVGQAASDAADLASQEKPVVAAAEADARALASEAVAGVEGIVDPAKPSA